MLKKILTGVGIAAGVVSAAVVGYVVGSKKNDVECDCVDAENEQLELAEGSDED